jgi:pimeloyl-ACP methyl ester carboxylesterase
MTAVDSLNPLPDPEHGASRSTDREARSRVGRVGIEDTDHEMRPVLLIGGQPGSSPIWTKVGPLLRSHGLNVRTIDRPDDRHASGAAGRRRDDAAATARLLDKRHASPAVIVAHSLGTATALALAATAPHHTHALVLIDPATGPLAVTRTDRLLAAPIIGPALSWAGFRTAGLALHIPALRAQILTRRFGLNVRQAKEVVRLFSHGKTWRSFTAEQRRLVAEARQLQERLREIHCPVVIVTAAHDRGLHKDDVAAMAEQLPAANVITTDAEDIIPIDDPQTVVKAIIQTLSPMRVKARGRKEP